MRNVVYERMMSFDSRGMRVRLWLKSKTRFESELHRQIRDQLTQIVRTSATNPDDALANIHRYNEEQPDHPIAAAEVLDPNGNGPLVYFDWP